MRQLSEREIDFMSLFAVLIPGPADRDAFVRQLARAYVTNEDGEHLRFFIDDPVPLLSAEIEQDLSRHALRFTDVDVENEIIEALVHCVRGKLHRVEWFSYAPGRRLAAVPAASTYLDHD